MNEKLKTYRIPCSWECYGYVEVKADSLEDALELAEEQSILPKGEYIEGSFEIDNQGVEMAYPEEVGELTTAADQLSSCY